MMAAVNVSALFTMRGHIAQFNETLDKIKQIYDQLNVHRIAPDNATYISVINLSTPPQYKWVVTMVDRQINYHNTYVATTAAQKQTMMPSILIQEL